MAAVVEGDVRIVTLAQRVTLWPAAIRILGFDDVVKAGEKGLLIASVLRDRESPGQNAQFAGGGAIVEGPLNLGAVAGECRSGWCPCFSASPRVRIARKEYCPRSFGLRRW